MYSKIFRYKLTSVMGVAILSISLLAACTSTSTTAGEPVKPESSSESAVQYGKGLSSSKLISDTDNLVGFDTDDETSTWESNGAKMINLKTDSITWKGDGVSVNGNKVTISSAGTYIISGSIRDSQIMVSAGDNDIVRLVLNGVDISSSDSAPIYIAKAKKAVITLSEDTRNNLTDGKSYVYVNKDEDQPNATIFSKSDLTINGTGSLTVNGNYKNAITSKDELRVMSGSITINSVGDGLLGRDFVAIRNGIVYINANEDGIKSNNDKDEDKGFVLIEDGSITITSQEDGIQAETNIIMKAGDLKIFSGGGSSKGEVKAENGPGFGGRGKGVREGVSGQGKSGQGAPETGQAVAADNSTANDSSSVSKKGLKAVSNLVIENGSLIIDSADDSMHSNHSIIINGGTIFADSGDDGIHADTSIEINGGNIDVIAYEGIEASTITINEGNIKIAARDDGLNASGGDDNTSVTDGQNKRAGSSSQNNSLIINGGYIYVDASGDGMDANGLISMTGGSVIVNGPTANNNGAVDYDGAFKITGGMLVAAGSVGMAQSPDSSSSQNSVLISFNQTMTAGTMVHVQATDGKEILSFVPSKNYQSVVISSPELKKGETYEIYYGGSSSGNGKDGLYIGGSYTGGTKYESFTIADSLTTIGAVGRGGFGGQGQGPLGGGGKRLP